MGKLHPNKAVLLQYAAATHYMSDGGTRSTNAYCEPVANTGWGPVISCSSFLFVASAWHQ